MTSARCEEWQRSLLLLAELEADASLRPNVITYNAVMSSCGQGTKWDISLYLLFLMRRSLLSADLISYNAAISACEAGQQWQAAVHLVSYSHGVWECVGSNPAVPAVFDVE